VQKFAQVLTLAQTSQVVIYCVGLISDDGDVNPAVLRHFAKATGGVAYFPDSKNSVARISTQIARDLREQYTLGFAPEKANNARAFRKIEVKVSAAGQGKMHARTRSGYSAPEDKPSASAAAAKGAE
jgi:VWFA-related protein